MGRMMTFRPLQVLQVATRTTSLLGMNCVMILADFFLSVNSAFPVTDRDSYIAGHAIDFLLE